MAKTPKTSAMRVKPVMRRATPEDASYCRYNSWEFYQHINYLTKKINKLKATAERLREKERLAQQDVVKWRNKWANLRESYQTPPGEL